MVTTANNVIQFPIKSKRPKITKVQAKETIDLIREKLIQEICDLVIPPMFYNLDAAGYSVDDDTMKDAALVVEAVKAFIYKTYGQKHHMHALAREMFDIDKDDNITIVAALNIK